MSVASRTAQTPPNAEQGWSPRLILSLFALISVVEVLTMSYMMVSTAIPLISVHYKTTQGAWLITSGLLVGAVVSPLVGKLADTHGKRRLLVICIGITILGSMTSAVAPNFSIMLLGRAISGVFFVTLFLGYSLIRDVFPSKAIPLAVAIVTSGSGVMAIPMPFISGWVLDSFGFRSVFWIIAGILAVSAALILATTPESPIRLRSTIDPVGAVLLGTGIGGVLIALSFGNSWGWDNTSTLAYLLGGIILLLAWIASARYISEPLIDLRLFGQRPVILIAVGAGFCYGIGALVSVVLPTMVMTPSALGLGYGFGSDAKGVALYQAPLAALTVIGGVVAGVLIGRNLRPRILMISSMFLFIVGGLAMAFAHDHEIYVILFAMMLGLATGIGYAAIPNLQIEAVPPQLQASTASMVSVFQSMFGAILPVIAFSIMNSHIAMAMEGAVVYSDDAIKYAWLLLAVSGLIGTAAAFLLPRQIVQIVIPPEQDAALAPNGVAPAPAT